MMESNSKDILESNDTLPKKEFYSIVTLKGVESLANAKVTGNNISLEYMAIGDGNGAYYAPDSKQVALVNEQYRIPLNRICVDPDYPNQILLEAAIPEEIGGFFIREIGIIDHDGNLFAVGKYPVTFKPLSESGSGKDLYIRMALGFFEAPSINLYINPNSSLVSADQIENFAFKDFSNVDDSLKTHQNFLELQGGSAKERYHLNKAEHDTASSLQQLLIEANRNKELAVNGDGNGFIVIPSKEIFQNVIDIPENTIVVKENSSIYKKTISASTDFVIDATQAAVYGKVITFEVWIVLPSIIHVGFTASIAWLNDDTPEYDEIGNYLVALRSFDGGKNWIGSLQGKWVL